MWRFVSRANTFVILTSPCSAARFDAVSLPLGLCRIKAIVAHGAHVITGDIFPSFEKLAKT